MGDVDAFRINKRKIPVRRLRLRDPCYSNVERIEMLKRCKERRMVNSGADRVGDRYPFEK